NKISIVNKIFHSQDVDLVVHDARITERNRIISNSLAKSSNSSSGVIKNFISNTYTGCCMAFKREVLSKVLPIPAKKGIFHDAWIGIMAEFYGYRIAFIDVPLIEFRRHDRNASTRKRRGLIIILSERIVLLLAIIVHIVRIHFKKKSY
ncbi:MAG: glycosyl transferase family 2, partial [Candidatus Heimdallarchaeota archaeon]|nr:glycosyl transferase family 2 [Candidatus Heimdallarchaeota archaeon]